MYRTALRSTCRPALSGARSATLRSAPRRFASTASPADKSRSWKSSAVRWGLAGGALYYYTTSSVFAEEIKPQRFSAAPSSFPEPETSLPTVESVIEDKRKQNEAKVEAEAAAEKKQQESRAKTESAASQGGAAPGSPEALEEEADQQGAFNPETGEINWDCPCLGGMADGPCGEEFKTAFSCFVYSTEEPKGMDCIEKFSGMQECFRKYPEIYGAELEGDQTDENGNPIMGEEEPETHSQASIEGLVAPASESKQAEPKPASEQAVEKLSDKTPGKPAEKEPTEKPMERLTEEQIEKKPEAPAEPTGPKWEDATTANAELEAQEQAKKEQPKKE